MKVDIFRWVEAKEKKSSVATAFGISRSTLSTILCNKADVKAKAAILEHFVCLLRCITRLRKPCTLVLGDSRKKYFC